ncbi:hypothetical protein GWI33_014320 [Rhynchophorus ferrugineus]|uniref:Uncharacterized protein n=1 Tax=Rhynchophorus ferrugineus TaxID=354439 RepID=A0A834I1W0_RHYFE|nr:hypothetical protein GWI33_014320 [Rhynchophorus ferrugineus]
MYCTVDKSHCSATSSTNAKPKDGKDVSPIVFQEIGSDLNHRENEAFLSFFFSNNQTVPIVPSTPGFWLMFNSFTCRRTPVNSTKWFLKEFPSCPPARASPCVRRRAALCRACRSSGRGCRILLDDYWILQHGSVPYLFLMTQARKQPVILI